MKVKAEIGWHQLNISNQPGGGYVAKSKCRTCPVASVVKGCSNKRRAIENYPAICMIQVWI